MTRVALLPQKGNAQGIDNEERNMKLKKGDKVTMLFHLMGISSEEECEVLVAHKDGTVTLKTDEDHQKCYRFDTKTGACLNDNTVLGAHRTLKLTA